MGNHGARFAERAGHELGHGQSFSIDTDEDLRRRAGQIRDLAEG